jgi:hypothetical protein
MSCHGEDQSGGYVVDQLRHCAFGGRPQRIGTIEKDMLGHASEPTRKDRIFGLGTTSDGDAEECCASS